MAVRRRLDRRRDDPDAGGLLLIHTIETESDGFVTLDDPTAVRNIEAAIRKYQPAIIGIDPLGDLGIGNLDTDLDMRSTCRALNKVCRAGDPQRTLAIVHHALTGKAGAAKATGWERSGFARNSKALLAYVRGQINIVPGSPDDNDTLVIACGKNNLGKEFSTFAVRLNPETMIYEVESDFDFEGWKEQVGSAKGTGTPSLKEVFRQLLKPGREYDKAQIAALLMKDKGIALATAYRWIDKGAREKLLRFNRTSEIYALA
jgi:hypothetical protein